MIFASFEFLVFFIIVLALNWILKIWPLWWRLFLLGASYFFYAFWDVKFLLVLLLVSLFNYYWAFLIEKSKEEKKKKIVLAASIIINVLVLTLFKYYGFFRDSAEALLNKFGFQPDFLLLNVVLPIGLSFYILRVISYSIDVFHKKILPEKSFIDFALYVAFFPQLLSGPIARANDFLPQLKAGGAQKIENLEQNFVFILSGLFKKLVISSYLTLNIVNDVFAVPQNHSQLAALLAMYAYALVIYCDFSGYTDISIGVAGLMGFKSPLNFNAPYLALDFQDFWRRWHISFSNWLRDYVYIPLGGNRKGKIRTNLNLLATMFVSGLWHGSGLNFIIWGLLHGLGLILSRFKNGFLEKSKNKINLKIEKLLSWFITFNLICFFWIFFGSQNLQNAFDIIRQIFNFKALPQPIDLYLILIIPLAFVIFALGKYVTNSFVYLLSLQKKFPFYIRIITGPIFLALIITLFAILMIKLGPDIVPPFIYFKF